MNFKLFDVFELCDEIKQDFFLSKTFHEKLFHRRLKSQANIFYTAIYVIVNHLSESNHILDKLLNTLNCIPD